MICPNCAGTGKAKLLPIECQWCRGIGRTSPQQAEQYADQTEAIARGGYICGDHSEDDMRGMLLEAASTRALAARSRAAGDGP